MGGRCQGLVEDLGRERRELGSNWKERESYSPQQHVIWNGGR